MPRHKMQGPLKDTEAMKMFKGKDTPAEEKKEAKALKDGKINLRQYKKEWCWSSSREVDTHC